MIRKHLKAARVEPEAGHIGKLFKKCAALSDHERRLVIMALAFQLEDLMTAQGSPHNTP